MADAERPIDIINRLIQERRDRSDAAILAELRALTVLPDEDDLAWEDQRTWQEHAYVYEALAALVGERRLRAGVPLLLERACYGDPGEMMRGLRHHLEAAYAPQYQELQPVCLAALSSPYPGARLWAASELAVLGDPLALPALIERLEDERPDVRWEALEAIARICRRDARSRVTAIPALQAQRARNPRDAEHLASVLAELG
jgi:HEAT repeat protein